MVQEWLQYSKSAPSGSSEGGKLWGYYQLVEILGESGPKRVLLMKSDSHLGHPPWISGLEDMVKAVVTDAKPQTIYSIGTAGGANVNQNLGDVAITNGGTLDLQLKENTPSGLNGKTYTSNCLPLTYREYLENPEASKPVRATDLGAPTYVPLPR